MMLKKTLLLLMLMLPASVTLCDDTHAHPSTHPAARAAATATCDLVPVACRYESSIIHMGRYGREAWDWTLWREPNRIEVCDAQANTGEIWERDGMAGRITSYMKVFHNEKRIIEMVPGDMATTRTEFNWDRLATVIGRETLRTRLVDAGEERILNRPARRYQGQINGAEVEVLWLEAEQVPAMIRQAYPNQVKTLLLKEIVPVDQAVWERTNVPQYEVTDFADIGDKETDPFLQRLGHMHHHGEHAH